MSSYAVLEITDGTTTVDLINPASGFFVTDWKPSVASPKGDGVWQDSPMADNRRMVLKRFANVTETLELQVRNWNPDALIESTQDLRRLLEKATDYWLDDWRDEPVWIKAQGRLEDNPRYAVIRDYRTPTDGFPYGEPFWNMLANSAMDDFPLVLERGHWQSTVPGTGECGKSSNLQNYYLAPNLLLNADFELWAGAVLTSWTDLGTDGLIWQNINRQSQALALSIVSGPTMDRRATQSVAVTPGDTIYYRFFASGDGVNAGQFGIYDVTNAAYIVAVATTGVTAATYTLVSGSFVVPALCVSARLELWCAPLNAALILFDNAYMYSLTGMTTASFGRTATCNEEVFVSNKHNQAQLTHIFNYDAAPVAIYSANLINAATPFALLPAVPAAGDMLYFGIDTSIPGAGPFSNLVFDIGTAQTALTGTWEYLSAGANWRAFDVAAASPKLIVDGWIPLADFFGATGVHTVVWSQFEPDNTNAMATGIVNGVTGYWIRWVCTVGAAAPPTQQNRKIYTAITPHVDIASTEIEGDIPATTQIYVNQWGAGFDYAYNYHRLLVASRSVSRGSDFTPYINLGGTQNNAAIVVTGIGATTTVNFLYSPAPTGYAIRYLPVGAEALANAFDVTISNAISEQYNGRFRVFLTVQPMTASPQTLTTQLTASYGSPGSMLVGRYVQAYQSGIVTTTTVSSETVYLIDYGVLTWPSFLRGSTSGNLRLQIALGASAAATYYQYQLILWPIDESVIDILSPGRSMYPAYTYDKMLVDGFGKDRQVIASTYDITLSRRAIEWQTVGGAMTLPPNTGQRVYVANFYNTLPHPDVWMQEPFSLLSVQTYKSQRYLSMRGSR